VTPVLATVFRGQSYLLLLLPHVTSADGTWPGLLDVFLGFLQREVLEGGKQLDATGNKVLRRIFTEADNPDRCGEGKLVWSGIAAAAAAPAARGHAMLKGCCAPI
jgi:hypothetical protein